ncbi:MAG: hypothetical protein AAF705_13330, partial [Bacteroidota bacterium]
MSPRLKQLICLFFLFVGSFRLSAQQYGYVQYNNAAEAPFKQVNTAMLDDEGFVWIGSPNGLYRFDGIDFELYSSYTESQFIHQLLCQQDQLLFVNDSGLYRVAENGDMTSVSPLIEGSIRESDTTLFYPNDFLMASDQSIWLSQSNHSTGRWQDGDFKVYPFSKSDKAQKLAIQEDSNGHIWVLSPVDGLFRLDPEVNEFEKVVELKNGKTLLIHDQQLVIGNEALHFYRMSKNRLRKIKTIPLEDDLVTAMHLDQKDQYYVGTAKGNLFKVTDLNKPPRTIYGANEAHRVEKLDFGYINEIHISTDSTGQSSGLWISSETGLWHLQQRFFKTVDQLPMNNPIGIALSEEGKAWIPINYLFEIAPQSDGFVAKAILEDLQVNFVAKDKNKALWVTVSTPKVELLKYVNNQLVRRYDFHKRGESIFYLYPDSQGNLWFN